MPAKVHQKAIIDLFLISPFDRYDTHCPTDGAHYYQEIKPVNFIINYDNQWATSIHDNLTEQGQMSVPVSVISKGSFVEF